MTARGGIAAAIAGGLVMLALGLALILAGGYLHTRTGPTGIGVGTGLKPGVIPAQYRGLILRAAKRCPEITAPLLAAQLETESSWNPNAVSGDNAQGLAQFIPSTWAGVGIDVNGNATASPFEPADAIGSQAKLMCSLVDQAKASGIDGDVIDLALAGYNAGFGAVQQYQGIPPYPQTQEYVPKIRQLASKYAAQPPAAVAASGSWVSPVSGAMTSGFGSRWGSTHSGVDIAGPRGTPIRAASSGVVIDAGPASGYGLWVRIRHGNGLVTEYGHMHRILVRTGQRVRAGQVIATRGDRGQSTGPHLHFEVLRHGQPIDPAAFYNAKQVPIVAA